MSTATKSKELFTVLGTIEIVKDETGFDRHRFIPCSPKYLSGMLSHVPVKTKVSCTFSTKIPTRSQGQLRYHWVLMHFLSEYSGFTPEEMHEIVLTEKFGLKTVKFNGKTYQIRQSISDNAKMTKSDCVELITHDLSLCQELGIVVPTALELGYQPN
jgi:hypothetical protein